MNAWNHGEAISFLANFSLDGLRMKRLTITSKSSRNIRPQPNLYLQAPKGNVKSSILEEIAAFSLSQVTTGITYPALVGSVDKETKQTLPAVAWKCRDKPLLIDEWADNPGRVEVINALLQITEGGKYSRDISRFMAPYEEKDGELYFRAKDGHISLRTRTSLILATMHNLLRSPNMGIQALISRCIPYAFRLTKEEMRHIIEGEPFLKLRPKKKIKETATIKRKDTARLLDYAEGAGETNYMRSFGDLARCFAIYGWRPDYFDFILERQNFAEAELKRGQEAWASRLENLNLSHRHEGRTDASQEV
jgi:uncharacterized C2H2 Zn-finger protein